MVAVHKLRHWKQRYDPNAAFICRRHMAWGGRTYEPGGRIPKELAANKGKLRRFWEASWIELAEFQAPDVATGQPMETPVEDPERPVEALDGAETASVVVQEAPETLPEGATMERRGSWHVVTMPDGSERKALGRKALNELLAKIGGCR